MTLLKALQHVGIVKREGQPLKDFAAEIKALNDADRAWFKERFAVEHGIEVVETPSAAAA